jgi:hypothetical protein
MTAQELIDEVLKHQANLKEAGGIGTNLTMEKLARMLQADNVFLEKLINDMGSDSLLGIHVRTLLIERDRIAQGDHKP